MSSTPSVLAARYQADERPPYSRLEAKPYFESLSENEKQYAHHVSRASFAGTRIIIQQTNPNALPIYNLILSLFRDKDGNYDANAHRALAQNSGVSEEAFEQFMQYAAQFLGNLSNYKSFGDEKFVPRLLPSAFRKIVQAAGQEELVKLFNKVEDEIYCVDNVARNLIGFPYDGHLSGYYSDNITKQDIELVQKYLEEAKIEPLNTRLFKVGEKYELHVASSETMTPRSHTLGNGAVLEVKYGDFTSEMAASVQALESALPFVANKHQEAMVKKYIESFRTGSVEAHMDSQRHWLKDIGPQVESNLGFIETYRDPQGVRAEWEGFVAMVNKEQTKKFNRLVDQAPLFVSRLPWPKTFERDTINKPDFTSLEVLSFATAGIPAGINIPNYTKITQVLGSKNVSLGNVISASSPDEKFPFVRAEDLDLYRRYRNPSFEVQVGTHELGHGTGKLLEEDAQGKCNFETGLENPITKAPVCTWYKPGQTFNSVFKSISSSYEECRAECIALTLSPHADILKIFDYSGEEAENILYVMYLNMARAGLTALEFYDPSAKKWGQAHMQARFAITNMMLKAGKGFLTFEPTTVEGQSSLEIHLDRSKIRSVGAPAVADFLEKLQVFKATADEERGNQLYREATSVPESWHEMRDIVIRNKQPRKVFVQGNTRIENGKVVLDEYEPSALGMIQSHVERRV